MMIAYGCIKLSIVAFYRRLFVVSKGTVFDIVTKVTMVIIFLWSFTFILMIIFDCGTHFWANWGSTPDQLELCPIPFTSEYRLTISDLILDVFIFLMPIPRVGGVDISLSYFEPSG